MDISFIYPEGGYLFYPGETAAVQLSVTDTESKIINVRVTCRFTDYRGQNAGENTCCARLNPGQSERMEFPLGSEKIGYYKAVVSAAWNGESKELSTGLGITTPHERSDPDDSNFGLCVCGTWDFKRDIGIHGRVGIRHLRIGPDTTMEYRPLLEKHGLKSTTQLQGRNIYFASEDYARWYRRYAPPLQNSAYYFEKEAGDLLSLTEHGNETWEEGNTIARVEWEKVSGFARITANPMGWYSPTGLAGIDINKLELGRQLGLMDYISFLSVHAYSFPVSPENPKSFWSIDRLKDLAKWMKENDIEMPVACTEQGYPAMYDQVESESYSPGDMVSFDAQPDYLVRSWLKFISFGVARVVWFSSTWYYGFGIMEKDAPAPWPAMLALCQLIRAVDRAEYIGDYQKDEGVYLKVFRDADGLFGVVWHPVWLARSCEKELNYSLDGTTTQDAGGIQEVFEYSVPFAKPGFTVKDIMGNPVEVTGNIMEIGEEPQYIYGLSEEILPHLEDLTLFNKHVKEKKLPCPVILGIGDAWPCKGAYVSSRFAPGESREYKVRVHNYSGEVLKDTVHLTSPEDFIFSQNDFEIEVAAGCSREFVVWVTTAPVMKSGTVKIEVSLKNTPAHPVFQLADVQCQVNLLPITKPLKELGEITLELQNGGDAETTYEVSISHTEIKVAEGVKTVTVPGKSSGKITFAVSGVPEVFEPAFCAKISEGDKTVTEEAALPLYYIRKVKDADTNSLSAAPHMVVSGYNLMMTCGERRDGPSLFGEAKPTPLTAYASMAMDDKKLAISFDVIDDTLVCVKNTRRDNIDCDGVWISFFKSKEDEKPYRKFCIMPVDALGRVNASVKEVAGGILFAKPYTDFDFENGIQVSSELFDWGYRINAVLSRSSLELDESLKTMVLGLRVINMDHSDWSRSYDTGKIEFAVY